MNKKIAVVERRIAVPTRVQIDVFGGYKPEGERTVDRVVAKENRTLKRLRGVFRRFSRLAREYGDQFDEIYWYTHNPLDRMVRGIDYSAKDVMNLSLALSEFREEKNFGSYAGLFISTLVNNSPEQEFTIITEHLVPIHFLGFKNRKAITIRGDVGLAVGYEMKGGTITVTGNAGAQIGAGMESGTIHLEGSFDAVPNPQGTGSIYHKGVPLVLEGKWVG